MAARVGTMVRYDGRGTGLSQRNVEDFSLEVLLADLDAVIADLDPPQVALSGVINSCPIAIAYAARHPERVSKLMLWCPIVDGSVHLENPRLKAARRVMDMDWETFSETMAQSGWLVRAGVGAQIRQAHSGGHPPRHSPGTRPRPSRAQCMGRTATRSLPDAGAPPARDGAFTSRNRRAGRRADSECPSRPLRRLAA